ncbi:hypothetical protein I203_100329 [Kwoniella mangroviensis CBS 8507]
MATKVAQKRYAKAEMKDLPDMGKGNPPSASVSCSVL